MTNRIHLAIVWNGKSGATEVVCAFPSARMVIEFRNLVTHEVFLKLSSTDPILDRIIGVPYFETPEAARDYFLGPLINRA